MVQKQQEQSSSKKTNSKKHVEEEKFDFDDLKEKAKDKVDQFKEKAKDATEDVREEMQNFGKSHPFPFLGQLEEIGVEYLVKKAPFHIPVGLKDLIVKLAPYITIIMLIMLIPVVLALLWLGSYIWGWAMMREYGYGYGSWKTMFYVTSILSLIVLVLEALAIPWLFKVKKQWWNLLFYAQLISVISTLISGNIVSAVISLVIGMYVLFQIRSYYK